MQDAFAEIKAETEIDVEADIIGQLRGNMGLLVNRAAVMGTDLMLLAQVRDPERFQLTVDQLTYIGQTAIEAKAKENPDSEVGVIYARNSRHRRPVGR